MDHFKFAGVELETIPNGTTNEKRLMVDIRSLRESYACLELEVVTWIRSEYKPAHTLTKPKDNIVMSKIIDSGKADHVVEQWVVRDSLLEVGN